jgi:hypothetical protein
MESAEVCAIDLATSLRLTRLSGAAHPHPPRCQPIRRSPYSVVLHRAPQPFSTSGIHLSHNDAALRGSTSRSNDGGDGMTLDDLRMIGQRHATSKW